MRAKQSLNEEQELGAKKDMGKFSHPIYEICAMTVTDEGPIRRYVYVEAARWFDARAEGLRHFGVPELESITLLVDGKRPLPRIQLRWVGYPSSGHNNLRVQTRDIFSESVPLENGWKDR